MLRELDELASRRVVLFGGKGGVGKTTISAAAAIHYAETRPTTLFTTDPASNLADLLGESVPNLTVESLDATALYARFLGANLESFLEIGDRGTYLDREELRRLFELSIPGVDELMAWMRIGELAESQTFLVVDTAPTGHTLRMLSASHHFHQLALALDAMQEKHRAMVFQFTRRDVRDAMDAFIDEFDARAARWRELLVTQGAFVPITLAEPLVIEQTLRLIDEVDLPVPYVIVNRAKGGEVVEGHRTVLAMRSCVPLDSVERLRSWSAAAKPPLLKSAPRITRAAAVAAALREITFLAGKGGVGKTSCAASIALQLAQKNPDKSYVVISVDPANSLADLRLDTPKNLRVETIDTRARWREFRDTLGREIENAVDSLTPRGMSIEHDTEAMRKLIEIAPPGADELFAITRLSDLFGDESLAGIIVDTAPTGHFLRLLDLPHAAGEWVREFMRLLLRYKDLIPPGSLGEELVRASRALRDLDATLRSDRAAVVVVTRPERIVVAETRRLTDDVQRRGIHVAGVIANYVTPLNDDACDQSMRAYELEALEAFGDAVVIERRERPPMTAAELASLVPL